MKSIFKAMDLKFWIEVYLDNLYLDLTLILMNQFKIYNYNTCVHKFWKVIYKLLKKNYYHVKVDFYYYYYTD